MKSTNLALIVLKSQEHFGQLVNEQVNNIMNTDCNNIIQVSEIRFNNGEGKIKIEESVRDKDIYILADVGNYSLNYTMHGMTHYMSPDEHFQDIKRVIAATSGHAYRVNVIMPLLYQARQHKKKGRESLDCAIALQELETLGVSNIITFDAHDPSISNAIPRLPFESFYPTSVILSKMLKKENLKDVLVVAPDMGATERARHYAEMLTCNVGAFYKRRDLTKVVNGKNPIIEHVYMGAEVQNKDIIVVDDMIASGSSVLEVAYELKRRGARRIYIVATFTLFTEGVEKFVNAYNDKVFDKVYSTNLSYVPPKIKDEEWYEEADCSNQLAKIICKLNKKESLSSLFREFEVINV